MLEIDSLTFSYTDDPLLNGLSLTVSSGEIVSIIGPSGSGKTTLFKLIAGIHSPQNGSIKASRLSYMMQEDLLLPWKTVLENLLFVFKLERSSHLNKEQQKIKVLDIIRDVGLEGFENYYPIALSGGMKQRVSLARILLLGRELLLLDEPFGAVDIFRRKTLYELLKTIHKKYQLTIVLITHDLRDALQLSHKIYSLQHKVLQPLTREAVLEMLQC